MEKTFISLAADFLRWARKCRTPGTVNVYRHYFSDFVAHHGDVALSDITPAVLMAWARTWHQVQAIKRLFKWAVEEACVYDRNPVERVKHPPKGQRHRIMAPAELAAILRAAGRDLRALLIGYRESIARPAELRRATWDDLQKDNAAESMRDALAGGRVVLCLWEFKDRARRQNPEAPRVILISPRLARLLLRLWDRQADKHGPIFRTKRGRGWTPNALRCRFRRLRVALSIERDRRGETITPYTFRHTSATWAAAAGVRDRILADVLGHVETRTTARYQHLQVEHLRSAMKKAWN